MRRTVNEKRAMRYFVASIIGFSINIGTFGVSVVEQNVILGALSIALLFTSFMYFGYSCYSLGWEYKRISLNRDASVGVDE